MVCIHYPLPPLHRHLIIFIQPSNKCKLLSHNILHMLPDRAWDANTLYWIHDVLKRIGGFIDNNNCSFILLKYVLLSETTHFEIKIFWGSFTFTSEYQK